MVEWCAMTQLILDRTPRPAYVAPVLDEEQLKVVAHRHGALRVLAGPGTGKTTTLVAAMAGRLVGPDALKSDQVLGLTFGRRAALEWRAQVTTAVGGGLVPHVSTFHSFCYALLRKFAPDVAFEEAAKLLSGPEQQVRARAMFESALADHTITWPDELAGALGTRGLIEEIRNVMSRTRSHMMEPDELVALGREVGRPVWEVVGTFMEQYLQVLDSEHAMDYAEVIYRAVLIAQESHVREYLLSTYRAVFVDEYQDTDPGQVQLLKAMVDASSSLIVVGDMDQAIYGFRGADETGLRDFAAQFEPIFGNDIHDVVLSTCRRFGQGIRSAATAVIEKQRPAGISQYLLDTHRNPTCLSEDPGVIDIVTYDSDGAQAAHIADLLARAHAHDSLAWSDMAVIVRSAAVTIPTIYRALVSAGIPVEVAADEIPLHLDPAAEPLMTMLRVIADERVLTPEISMALLTGPLGGLDTVDIRRFARYLREQDRAPEKFARSSGELITEALASPNDLLTINEPIHASVIAGITRVGQLINKCRVDLKKGATAHEILWDVWQGSTWPQSLQQAALGFGPSAQRAHRDLDAICALFDQANRYVARGGARGLSVFLGEVEAQEIPAEALADNQVRSDTVRLLTAHRSKGLQWPLVVVAAVQEDLWPDVRLRSTLLQANRIGPRMQLMPDTVKDVLASERRLFYVALTRAMQRVVVTAVQEEPKEEGESPSRFIDDVLGSVTTVKVRHEAGRPRRALSPDGVVGELRRVLADPQASETLKNAAANRLATLVNSGSSAFRHADPSQWWGVLARTENETHKPHEPIRLSSTSVVNIEDCPAQWFLTREVQAVSESQTHMLFGTILHSIAQGLQTGEIKTDITAIDEQLDKLWSSMGYEAGWEAEQERSEAHDASVRLLNWFMANSKVHSIAESTLELTTELTMQNPDGTSRSVSVFIRGSADRVQFDTNGVLVYDYKTGRKKLSASDLATNLQLALYSYLIESGTYTDGEKTKTLSPDTSVVGAAQIYLRMSPKGDDTVPDIGQVANGQHDSANDISLNDRLVTAAAIVLDEKYEARPEDRRCGRCPVQMLCPAVSEGQQVL